MMAALSYERWGKVKLLPTVTHLHIHTKKKKKENKVQVLKGKLVGKWQSFFSVYIFVFILSRQLVMEYDSKQLLIKMSTLFVTSSCHGD